MNFRSEGFLAEPRPPGCGRIFDAATPPRALVHVKKVHAKKVTVTFFFRPTPQHAVERYRETLKILVTLRTAVLQVPSKSYENCPVRSAFVQLSRNETRSGRTG